MSKKYFDIPFLSHSSDSDFSCKDGEIEGWKDGNNENGITGETPIIPEIEFAIVMDILHGWHIHPDTFPAKNLVASEPSMEYWNRLTAQLLAQFQYEASIQGLFVSPFYVLAAWKTYSGNYLSPTQPTLLIPNSEIPVVTTDGDITATEPEFKISATLGRLYYKLRTPEILRDWVGKIESLVIFVSSPLQKYETYSSLLPVKHVTTDNYCECLDLETGEIKRERICNQELSIAWKGISSNTPAGGTFNDKVKFYPVAELPLSNMAPTDEASWKGIGYEETGMGDGIEYGVINDGNALPKKSEPLIIEGKNEEIRVLTRPLKLICAGELKSMRHLHLRGKFTSANLTMAVYGSRDMLKWWCISKRKGGTVVSLPRSPFRFYKLEISGLLEEGETLEGITLLKENSEE